MKTLLLVALPALAVLSGCSSSRHLAVGESTGKPTTPTDCFKDCRADVRCLPNGNLLISCTKPDGKQCEIEIACDGESCEVVRCVGDKCCAAAESK